MIAAIAAVDNNFGIGYKNQLLAHISEDLQNFKKLTSSGAVVMGRKTYDSLPKKPLPNRINIVITNQNIKSTHEDVIYLSLESAIKWMNDFKEKINIYVIGGDSIYKQLLPYCNLVYLTKIYKSYKEVDSYFPNLDKKSEWIGKPLSNIKEDKKILYRFWLYSRQ